MENGKLPLLERAGEIVGFARDYVEKRLELYQLQVAERVIQTLSALIMYFLLFIFFILALIFASVAAGFFLADALKSPGWGFVIVTGFYFLLAALLFLFRRPLIMNPVVGMVLHNLREDEDEDEDENDQNKDAASEETDTNQQNQRDHVTAQGYSDHNGSAPAQDTAEERDRTYQRGS